MTDNSVDWDLLKSQVGKQIAASLKGLVDGAASDLQAYGNMIASEMIWAYGTGDQAAIKELKAQLKVLAEMRRVKIAAGRETLVLSIISAIISVATSGLLAAGAKLGNISGE